MADETPTQPPIPGQPAQPTPAPAQQTPQPAVQPATRAPQPAQAPQPAAATPPIPPVQPQTPPVQPGAPTPQTPPTPPTGNAHSKTPLIIGLVILVLALVIGGVFVIMSRQTLTSQEAPERSSGNDAAMEKMEAKEIPTTAPETMSKEEKELEEIDLGDIESEFESIESDIDQL